MAPDDQVPDVCVVTHPLAAAGENATRSLLDILGAITGAALVTADLPADSEIRESHEVVEVSQAGAGDSIVVAAARFVANQFRMALAVRRRPEPVVLFFGATAYILPIVVARLAGKTVVLEPRGDVPLTLRIAWERRLPPVLARGLAGSVGLLERAGLGVADAVITYTPAMARELGLDPDSPGVYPTGARYVRIDEFRVEVPYEDREPVVGFVGRLDEEKGVRDLAAAAGRLPEDLTVRFVGDGDLREWLEATLDAEVAAGSVEFAGWVDHDAVPAELNRMRLLVLPSRPTEGLPTTILEAMACGTPVLASPVAGVPDVVTTEETGFHLTSRNPAALADRIESILDRSDLDAISRRGRDLIESEYSFDAACERYRHILAALG